VRNHSTTLDPVKVASVVVAVRRLLASDLGLLPGRRRWRLTLADSVALVLVYLRENPTQRELALRFGVSAPTVGRTIRRLMPVVRDALAPLPGAVGCGPGGCVVDGTLVPTPRPRGRGVWGHATYSGRHRRYGVNVQVVSDRNGRLLDVARPVPGSVHDRRAVAETGIEDAVNATDGPVSADLGYVGTGWSVPVKRRPGGRLTDAEREENRAHASNRWPVERTNAHLKSWRVLRTVIRLRFRDRLAGYALVIATVARLCQHFLRRPAAEIAAM